ncbi:aminotransferase class I/II-fold pyridoxal phosphate-dependent enzyme, partial [Phenylobacterium sp.]
PGDWFSAMPARMQASRDRLTEALTREGFSVARSQGTYFLTIDLPGSGVAEADRAFALRAVTQAGVAAIPVSAFYETEAVTRVLRLCFAKADDVLDAAATRLARARDLSLKATEA